VIELFVIILKIKIFISPGGACGAGAAALGKYLLKKHSSE
jgi:hypothetical protein